MMAENRSRGTPQVQLPAGQSFEQQSTLAMQGLPGPKQHLPPVHLFEQH
jgi:hypothetical protein